MRLYKLSAPMGERTRTKWLGTQSECASMRKDWVSKLGYKRDDITTDEIDVPTTKKELLEWLNANAT